jgi:hypothetical protein
MIMPPFGALQTHIIIGTEIALKLCSVMLSFRILLTAFTTESCFPDSTRINQSKERRKERIVNVQPSVQNTFVEKEAIRCPWWAQP